MSESIMADRKSVLILGATGGFGSALSNHLAGSGWQVKALTRRKKVEKDTALNAGVDSRQVKNNIHWVVGNLDEPASLQPLARGVDLIVHAVNVPYPKWDPLMVQYTQSIIDLAKTNQAQLMFVGNIYNAGLPKGGVITEYTEHAPVNEKGKLRATLEDMLESASRTGVPTTIMRFGDFFGPNIPTANWFDLCTKGVEKNKLTMAGPADVPHSYAYLPDAVSAMERVATIRLQRLELPAYMVLPFEGHVFSFLQLKESIEACTNKALKIGMQPWWLFRLLGIVFPMMRDLVSMRYLWNHDIRMDNSALNALLGDVPVHTPLQEAIQSTIPGWINIQDQKNNPRPTNTNLTTRGR